MALWTPQHLSSTKSWLEADTLSGANNSDVSNWPDSSGNSNAATSLGNNPQLQTANLNSLNVIRFVGANTDLLFLPSGALTGWTEGSAFFVARAVADNTTSGPLLGAFGSSGYSFERYGDVSGVIASDFLSTTAKTPADPGDVGAWHIGSFQSKANDWRYAFNGTDSYTTGTNTVGVNTGRPQIGVSAGGGAYFDGYVAEIVICSSFLSASDRQLVEGYLAWKWGLQANLPGGHPYASAAPTVVLGTVAATEAADTSAASAVSPIKGATSATEVADTSVASAVTPDHAAVSATEVADSGSSTAIAPAQASLAATEIADSAVATAVAAAQGTVSATEIADSSTATAIAISGGSVNAVEVADSVAASAVSPDTAGVTATEIADTATAAAVSPIYGDLAVSEAADTAIATAVGPETGTVSAVETADSSTSTAIAPASGTLAAIEQSDSGSASGFSIVAATASTIEAADSSSSSAISPITAALAATEAHDTSVSAAIAPASATLAAIEIPDTANVSGVVFDRGSANALENADSVAAYGTRGIPLVLGVVEENYGVIFPAQVRMDQVEGRASRFRRNLMGANPIASVQWITDRDGYEYLQAFYRVGSTYGSGRFVIDLIVESGQVEEYDAQFVAGSFQLAAINGDAFSVTAQLEVTSMATTPEGDAAILMLYGHYGDDSPNILSHLAELVNVTLPEDLR